MELSFFERIVDLVMQHPPDERINVLSPVVRGRKGEFKRELAALRGELGVAFADHAALVAKYAPSNTGGPAKPAAGVVAETGRMPLVLQLMAAANQSQGWDGVSGSTAPRVR